MNYLEFMDFAEKLVEDKKLAEEWRKIKDELDKFGLVISTEREIEPIDKFGKQKVKADVLRILDKNGDVVCVKKRFIY